MGVSLISSNGGARWDPFKQYRYHINCKSSTFIYFNNRFAIDRDRQQIMHSFYFLIVKSKTCTNIRTANFQSLGSVWSLFFYWHTYDSHLLPDGFKMVHLIDTVRPWVRWVTLCTANFQSFQFEGFGFPINWQAGTLMIITSTSTRIWNLKPLELTGIKLWSCPWR